MKTTVLVMCLFACSKTKEPPKVAASDPPKLAATSGLSLGDATVFELVDRRFNKREKPVRDLVLHADGKCDLIHDKTDEVLATLTVKPDGTVLGEGKPMWKIGEHEIKNVDSGTTVVTIDGNAVSLVIDGKPVKVTLADDGNITVVDRPDGNKWRIEAADAAVRRTAFLVLALQMNTALD